MKKAIVIALVVGSLIVASLVLSSWAGCSPASIIYGNKLSEGQRWGHLHKISNKQSGALGTKSYEIELGTIGYGTGNHVGKTGQGEGGAWHANVMDETLANQISENVKGWHVVKVYYIEQHVKIEGGTNYRVVGIEAYDKGEQVLSLHKATK